MNRTLRVAAVDVAFGRKVCLQVLPREGPESAQDLPLHYESEIVSPP